MGANLIWNVKIAIYGGFNLHIFKSAHVRQHVSTSTAPAHTHTLTHACICLFEPPRQMSHDTPCSMLLSSSAVVMKSSSTIFRCRAPHEESYLAAECVLCGVCVLRNLCRDVNVICSVFSTYLPQITNYGIYIENRDIYWMLSSRDSIDMTIRICLYHSKWNIV